jgi:hypothetical protein
MSQQRTQQASRPADQRNQQASREGRTATRPQTDMHPLEDVVQYVWEYTRERPETVAMACFAVGFILGWRLKPW